MYMSVMEKLSPRKLVLRGVVGAGLAHLAEDGKVVHAVGVWVRA